MIQKGSIVTCVVSGDFGKSRPAVVVQSDLFNETHQSITICPITTHIVDAPLFRLLLAPDKINGLKMPSQIMVDKVVSIKRDKIRDAIGKLTTDQMVKLDKAIVVWLDLSKQMSI